MIWLGKKMSGYEDLVAARLRKLGAAQASGMLPFSGPSSGAMFFHDGQVVWVVSRRTPGLVGECQPDTLSEGSPLSQLAALTGCMEPALDAALELLSGEARLGKFQPGKKPPVELPCSLAVEDLLAEIFRRRRLLDRLSGTLTADTPVRRNPELAMAAVRVSAIQWALLIRVRGEATPRGLAWELGRSVLSTTVEVYRLLQLCLLSAPTGPGDGRDLSFIGAVPAVPTAEREDRQ